VPRFPRRSKSSVPADAHALAAGFYVGLLDRGYGSLARQFARWWLATTGGDLAEAPNIASPLEDLPGENYSLDELGIDQEDFEWP
jgi:hypothetical protein